MASDAYSVVDTHTHLGDSLFDKDRDVVIERAMAAGVSAIVIVSETLSDVHRNLELASSYRLLWPAGGLYPTHLDTSEAEKIGAFIRKERHKFIAIGEVGLYYWAIKQESEVTPSF